jgi:UDP-N-acetylmuramate: L-alanyl-gamma-D-glutamyl-meso-diaminopimelate ligase
MRPSNAFMKIFVAGICGTFMAGLAVLAREAGHAVRGCDVNVYPPMSEQLASAGIEVLQGYDPAHLWPRPDLVVIGNALSRGNPLVEEVLEAGLAYTSGPEWLWDHVLCDRHVLAVSGTHGKTTTSSMLARILDVAGLDPGFLIGGVPADFGVSARLGRGKHFVIEADEYDTAFFDKRSKFVHYRPRTLLINNIEYDHADIFPDLEAIERQFHHLVRTVPSGGCIVYPSADAVVERVLARGCWSRKRSFAVGNDEASASARDLAPGGAAFTLCDSGREAKVKWSHTGVHNVANAVAATVAALDVGAGLDVAAEALSGFAGVKRRMELVGIRNGIAVFDDFAHHPTAIATTLEGVRAAGGTGRVIAVIEPRSNTMRLGAHRTRLPECVGAADRVLWFQPPGMDWDMEAVAAQSRVASAVHTSVEGIIQSLVADCVSGDRIVVMSNGGFQGIHRRLLDALEQRS